MSQHPFFRTCFLLAVSLFSTLAFAQNTSVSGVVTDPQGSALPGVTITLTNKVTGVSRTVTTAENGAYQIPQVAPGRYKIKAEATGFASLENPEVQVLVNTPLTLNLAFKQVGAISDTVTVTGGETTLNTTDATIGNSFNATKVIELPLNARNIPGLLSLQSGVTPATGDEDDVQRGGHVNGARSDQSNVTLDGVDVNEQQGGKAFFSVLRLTPDSLQEFRVTTTNANADAGRSSGAQVALVTKSGTDQFHGSLYEYHRNTVTSANDWFNNKAGVERPALIRNNFGGSLGGPIKRGRAFFFFNYEGFREAKGTSIVRTVPLPTLGQGIVRYKSADGASDPTCPAGTPAGTTCQTAAQINAAYVRANGVTPGINNTALAVLAGAAQRYRANDTSTGDGLNTSGFRFNSSAPVQQDTYIARFDFNLASNHVVFARLNYQNDNNTIAATDLTGQRFPDTPAPAIWNHPKGLSVGHSWTISNTLVNNFRYGLTRAAFSQGGDSAQSDVIFRYVFEPFNYQRTIARVTPVHNIIDDISWSKGTHSLQFGTNMRFITNNRLSFATAYDYALTNPSYYDLSGDVLVFDEANGDPIFPNMADPTILDLRGALAAVIGRFSEYGSNINYDASGKLLAPGTGIGRVFKTQEYEFYAQDSWRMKQNLTVTYGLRYSTTTPLYEANGV
ncbi:MAG TPA: TonB-dependent receptor, partial [Blastocatellia bacterium]|nr:TonB-dependent receptor [Blastocatellia bacterium]